MKKIIYLCGMMLLSMNIMAQIDLNDDNWECFIDEDFSGVRSWDSHWDDTKNEPDYKPLWRCFSYSNWNSGVTGDIRKRSAYQKTNAVFGSDNTMKLIGELKSQTPMRCDRNVISDNTYSPAPWYKYCHFCDDEEHQHPYVHYYSGKIETINPVGFGYYEIECKMPIHDGANSAFWFWSDLGGTYNEIDVFEHCTRLSNIDLNRQTLSGIWYNPNGTNYAATQDEFGNIIAPGAQRVADYDYFISNSQPALDDYHTFGCLWMPTTVKFYVDGEMIYEFYDSQSIPQSPMWLMITHMEDKDAKVGLDRNNDSIWGNWHDEMTINYVKGYRLRSSCSDDVAIRNAEDFNNYVYSTKHTIVMEGQTNTLTIPADAEFTLRATESITINNGFELLQGSQMTLLVHDCPECSMEGVDLPDYSCGMDNENE